MLHTSLYQVILRNVYGRLYVLIWEPAHVAVTMSESAAPHPASYCHSVLGI